MTRDEFLAAVRTERARFDAAAERLDAERMVSATLEDGRTAKDILAHVAWYDGQMVGVLRARALVGSELWELSQPERNAIILKENKQRPLDDVLSESRHVFEELSGLMETLEEEELREAGRFAEMPDEWEPIEMFAGNTYEHYAGHLPELEELLGA